MSEIISTARSAREALAQGLNALQADANAPANYISAAEPIAMAMGALHRIERSAGAELAAAAPQALDAVRQALGILQTESTNDPRLLSILEMVAGSLGMVFSLTKAAKYGPAPQPAAAAPQPAAQPYAPPPQAAPQYAPAPQYAAPPQYAPQPQPAPYQAPAPQPSPQAPYAPPPQPAPQPYAAPAPVAPQQQFAAPQPDPFAAPAAHQAAPWNAPPQAQPAPQPQASVQPTASTDEIRNAKLPQVDAELGTHSVSNFYKGLSGNDVIDHGGLFVSTYNIPQIGQQLKVHVALPGGFEFDALGVVRWTREARESISSDISPPGFGLQFTTITPEARNLVYRYVRNREPIFHDDL